MRIFTLIFLIISVCYAADITLYNAVFRTNATVDIPNDEPVFEGRTKLVFANDISRVIKYGAKNTALAAMALGLQYTFGLLNFCTGLVYGPRDAFAIASCSKCKIYGLRLKTYKKENNKYVKLDEKKEEKQFNRLLNNAPSDTNDIRRVYAGDFCVEKHFRNYREATERSNGPKPIYFILDFSKEYSEGFYISHMSFSFESKIKTLDIHWKVLFNAFSPRDVILYGFRDLTLDRVYEDNSRVSPYVILAAYVEDGHEDVGDLKNMMTIDYTLSKPENSDRLYWEIDDPLTRETIQISGLLCQNSKILKQACDRDPECEETGHIKLVGLPLSVIKILDDIITQKISREEVLNLLFNPGPKETKLFFQYAAFIIPAGKDSEYFEYACIDILKEFLTLSDAVKLMNNIPTGVDVYPLLGKFMKKYAEDAFAEEVKMKGFQATLNQLIENK